MKLEYYSSMTPSEFFRLNQNELPREVMLMADKLLDRLTDCKEALDVVYGNSDIVPEPFIDVIQSLEDL